MLDHLPALAATTLWLGSAIAQTTWTSLSNRVDHALASDAAGGVLLFGGRSTGHETEILLADTHAFSAQGSTPSWTLLGGAGPSARRGHALAATTTAVGLPIYVLFGGVVQQPNGVLVPSGETFPYGGGWRDPIQQANGPSPRWGHAMVTDTLRRRIVLFGGFNGAVALNDLWEFDPDTELWSQPPVVGAMTPTTRFEHAMAFYPGNGTIPAGIFVFGGAPPTNDLWELQFSAGTQTYSWTQIATAGGPTARREAAMAYLPGAGHLVLFGGRSQSGLLGDTWTLTPQAGGGTWASPPLTKSPAPRIGHAMSVVQSGFDVVLLGGNDGSSIGGGFFEGTWLWDGAAWREELPPPSARTGVAMAYDENRGRHVLFGGRDAQSGQDSDETWELDGLDWSQPNVGAKPSPRADAGICFDRSRGVAVLFGGRSGGPCGTELGDTWEWNGQSWLLTSALTPLGATAGGVQPVYDSTRNRTWMLVGSDLWRRDSAHWTEVAGLPIPLSGAAGAFDTARGRFVVFGGARRTTREWDGGPWQSPATPMPPPVRYDHTLAYHEQLGKCVLFGGRLGTTYLDDTWLWDGLAWSLHSLHGPPPARFSGAMAYDPIRGEVVLFGGTSATPDTRTWLFGPSGWLPPISAPTVPPGRDDFAMAWDPVNQAVLAFGGSPRGSGVPYLDDTWLWHGQSRTWSNPSTSVAPGEIRRHALSTTTNGVLLVGGARVVGAANTVLPNPETWLWNGTTWSLVALNQYLARTEAIAAWDPAQSQVLLHGGDRDGSPLSDTWQWDGQAWTVLDSGTPPPRTDYAAAHDERLDSVIVFGGRQSCGAGRYFDETWEWKDGRWQQRLPPNSPSPRAGARLTFDAARGVLVLFGGTDGINVFLDSWEWDGVTWTARAPSGTPATGSSGHGLSYDQGLRMTAAFGPFGTWHYGPVEPASIAPFGAGCQGSNGIPTLAPKPWAGPWLGDRAEIDIVDAPPGLGLFVWGFSNTTWIGGALPFSLAPLGGGPGCNLLVSDTIVQAFVSNSNPYPYVSFVLPSDPSFLGAVMYTQAGFLDAGLAGAPVASPGLELTFGSK
ncbi:MAG: hypothetical protein KDE27_26860 [Planctomycetes bacterium]|nr:hypothetical protein [Planctomycetota bacterium]